jgi:hypothetical protein
MTALLSLLTSGGLGFLGTIAQGWFEVWRAGKESERRIAEMRALSEMREQEAAWNAFTAAQNAEAATNTGHSWPWVEAVKTLWRPFLTLLLLGVLAWYMAKASDTVFASCMEDLKFCAFNAIGFWFGSRFAAQVRAAPTAKR